MTPLGKGVRRIFPKRRCARKKSKPAIAGSPVGCRLRDARWLLKRSVTRDQDDGVVLVEFDIDRAHLAFGVVDLVDALLFFLDLLVALAAERGESGLDLLDLGGGHLVVVIVFGESVGGGGQGQDHGKSNSSSHAKTSGSLSDQQFTWRICH